MPVQIIGLEELEKHLKKCATLDDVRTVVKKHGSKLHDKIVENAEFKGHYEGNTFVPPTGATKQSVSGRIVDGGMTYETGPKTHYSPYLEYGTRFMDAQPFVKPSFDEVKDDFKEDLKKLMK